MSGVNSQNESGSEISNKLKDVFTFPDPVNEYAARTVAGMVVILSVATILTGQWWLAIILAYGFLARVATGPTLSPMGLLATRLVVPIIGNPSKLVPGPPKRFAQGIGLVFSVASVVLYFVVGSTVAASLVLGVLAVFAFMESALGFCAGCFVFGYMIRWRIIPESVCRQCVVDYRVRTES